MNEMIRKQILAVRATGEVNMFNRCDVQMIANEIEECPKAYQHFTLTGEIKEE
jgi:hypothetical protein